jgi:hypothetical protein
MTMLIDRVMTDPDNDLVEIARAFAASGKPSWHVDRHVLDPLTEGVSDETRREACAVALALARRWLEQAATVRSSGLLVSNPVAIVDETWLAGRRGAPPPHVYVCVALDPASFVPVTPDGTELDGPSGNPIIDSLAHGGERIVRSTGADADHGGAWMFLTQ